MNVNVNRGEEPFMAAPLLQLEIKGSTLVMIKAIKNGA